MRRSLSAIISWPVHLNDFKGDDAIAIGAGLARLWRVGERSDHARIPAGGGHGFRDNSAGAGLRIVAIFNVGEYTYEFELCIHAFARGSGLFQEPDGGDADRGVDRNPERVANSTAAIPRRLPACRSA